MPARLIISGLNQTDANAMKQTMVENVKQRGPDAGLRVVGDTLEIDYTYNDFGEKYRTLRQFLAGLTKIKNEREPWLEKFATASYRKEMKESLENVRDGYRDFDWQPEVDPGLDPTMTQQQGTAQCMGAADGMCLGGGHSAKNTKAMLCNGLDDGSLVGSNVGMLFIEEIKTWAQPMIENYFSLPAGSPMPKDLDTYLTGLNTNFWKQDVPPENFKTLVEKAQAKGVKIYGIDAGAADPGVNNQSAVHPERRVALMNKVAQDIIENAKKDPANQGKKFIAMVGGAHSNSHEGGIPGLAQLLGVPAVALDGNDKLTFVPDDPTNHAMPSKEEQLFIDRLIEETEKAQGGPISETSDPNKQNGLFDPNYKVAMRKYAKAEAARLKQAGQLSNPGAVEGALSLPEVKQAMAERVKFNDLAKRPAIIKDLLVAKNGTKAIAYLKEDPRLWDSDLDASNRGRTPMHLAALLKDPVLFGDLAAAGGDVNKRSPVTGDTPLTELCWDRNDAKKGEQATMAEFLLGQNGVDKDAVNNEGRSAVHLAAWNGNEQALDKLHTAGADGTKPDSRGWTPAQVAMTSTKNTAEKFFYDKGLATNPPLLGPNETPSTVDLLLKATLFEPPMDVQTMRKTYEELYSNPALQPVMDLVALDAARPRDPSNPDSGGMRFVVANDDNVGKLYHTTDSTPPEGAYDEGANIVMFGANGSKNFAGTIAHEMTHAAARIVHGGSVIPADNGALLTEYKEAIAKDTRKMDLLDKSNPTENTVVDRINGRMDTYLGKSKTPEKALLQEFIVGVPQLIAEFGEGYVRKNSPELTKYFDDFNQRCKTTATTKFATEKSQVDNSGLATVRTSPEAQPVWYKGENSGVDKLMEKIRTDYKNANGVPKKATGVDIVYSGKIIEIPEDKKKDFESRMKSVEKALGKAIGDGPICSEISSDMFRDFVLSTSEIASGNPKDIEKSVTKKSIDFVRTAKKSAVYRKIDTGQELTDLELAESIVLQAEDRVFEAYPPDDDEATVEVNAKEHKKVVASLAEKLKGLPGDKKTNPRELITKLSDAVAGGPALGFYKKTKDIKGGTAKVSIDLKAARKVWIEKLAKM